MVIIQAIINKTYRNKYHEKGTKNGGHLRNISDNDTAKFELRMCPTSLLEGVGGGVCCRAEIGQLLMIIKKVCYPEKE